MHQLYDMTTKKEKFLFEKKESLTDCNGRFVSFCIASLRSEPMSEWLKSIRSANVYSMQIIWLERVHIQKAYRERESFVHLYKCAGIVLCWESAD